ncbi:hypothetical protein EYF80_032386 [Liparis tanakae]|uniref:Uncharacterized protein n=1 Tax=Liparis tanakae TaxID=230148 RepID=A0A4Z2GUW1_9TELE|nr:hypothetical protein EYF80_032386 [Liparis tanakae]
MGGKLLSEDLGQIHRTNATKEDQVEFRHKQLAVLGARDSLSSFEAEALRETLEWRTGVTSADFVLLVVVTLLVLSVLAGVHVNKSNRNLANLQIRKRDRKVTRTREQVEFHCIILDVSFGFTVGYQFSIFIEAQQRKVKDWWMLARGRSRYWTQGYGLASAKEIHKRCPFILEFGLSGQLFDSIHSLSLSCHGSQRVLVTAAAEGVLRESGWPRPTLGRATRTSVSTPSYSSQEDYLMCRCAEQDQGVCH